MIEGAEGIDRGFEPKEDPDTTVNVLRHEGIVSTAYGYTVTSQEALQWLCEGDNRFEAGLVPGDVVRFEPTLDRYIVMGLTANGSNPDEPLVRLVEEASEPVSSSIWSRMASGDELDNLKARVDELERLIVSLTGVDREALSRIARVLERREI